MKIDCIGGGPAGLYFAILAKRLDDARDVTVYERNAKDDTFGWGVVFSDETLENLAQADAPSFEAITRGFARWDAIDVRFRGTVTRSRGHGFCGISRKHLLSILQGRAAELGVRLVFGEEVAGASRSGEADLVVAADGVHSATRAAHALAFVPALDVRPNRYIWLGTKKGFDAFTFAFRENEHGVFQAHAYQFEPKASTFIVECDERTWLQAGLDRASVEESVGYCERLFEDDLGGEPLLVNGSRWIQFATLTNEKWHHENVVLLGDAAHTAHFSIGSGTKLAMEDAMALAKALGTERTTLADALEDYEQERRPVVARVQRAAQRSLEWFESVGRYVPMPPPRFVFSLLTRSLRVTRENLKLRDPQYIEQVDRWHMSNDGLATAPGRTVAPPMFLPFNVRGVVLDNRVVVSPMCQYAARDGLINDWHFVHLGSRALGGAGLVMAEMTCISSEGRITPGCAGLYTDAHESAWAKVVDFVHAQASRVKLGMQLGHAGRKGSTRLMWEGMDEPLPGGNWPLLGPSALPYRLHNQIPREMTVSDMRTVREQFVEATRRVVRAGFDWLELHYAHGYLMSSFLTPVSNKRTDDYGGSLANRARFPLEVLDAVRQVWSDKPLSVRISATDWVPDGVTDEESVELARMLAAHGCDVVDVSAGQTTPEGKPVYGRAFQTPWSDRIRNEAHVSTITVGNIATYDDVNTILVAGRADLVALARAHLADPYWTLHAAREQGYEGVAYPLQYASSKRLSRLVK